ncbi:MAG: SLBB domain-containing protein [Candidatus Sericytochromatia bacterium]
MKLKVKNSNIITKIFLSLSIILTFNLNAYSENELDYKTLIQKNLANKQPINIIQRSNFNTISNDFIPENGELLTDYKLGVGDNIQINLISKEINLTLDLVINPEGKIFIPKIGEFLAYNLTTDELKNKIISKIGKKLKEYELSILINKIKTIKVTALGYINKAGNYTIPQFTRLIDFLKLIEGISENGSYRKIQIISNDNKEKYYDLYDFIYKNKQSENPILKAGDKIIILPIKTKIIITGNVLKSGLYELKSNKLNCSNNFDCNDLNKESLLDSLKIAGLYDLIPTPEKIIILKNGFYDTKNNNIITTLKEIENKNIIQNEDIIFVPASKQYTDNFFIYLYGQVNKQGTISFKEGMRISDYIKLSGGLSSVAELEKVKIIRNKNGLNQNIIVDLNEILFNGNKEKDIILEPDDIIYIPEKFFNFKNFNDITSVVLSTLGIVSLVLSFIKK